MGNTKYKEASRVIVPPSTSQRRVLKSKINVQIDGCFIYKHTHYNLQYMV